MNLYEFDVTLEVSVLADDLDEAKSSLLAEIYSGLFTLAHEELTNVEEDYDEDE